MPEPTAAAPSGARLGPADLAVLALFVAVVVFCALRPEYDIDIWWHIAVGRWILDHGQLPDRDYWSAVEPAAEWRSFEWLYQLGVAWLDRHFGLAGVRAVNVAWLAGAFAGCFVALRRAGRARSDATLLVALLVSAFLTRMRLRPETFNLTAWLVVALYVARGPRPRPWHLAAAAVFFLAWGALHRGAAWLGVCAVVATALATLVVQRVRGRVPGDTLVLGLALAALLGWLVVPGGAGVLAYMAGQHGATMHLIDEWDSWPATLVKALGRHAAPHLVVILALWPAALGLWAWRCRRFGREVRDDRRRATDLYPLVLAAALLTLAFAWFRFNYLAVLAMLLLVPVTPPARSAAVVRNAVTAAVLLAALHYTTVVPFGSVAAGIAARGQVFDGRRFPVEPTAILAASGIEARVATPAGWGGFVLYHGWPRLRVTVDGRFVAPESVVSTTEVIRQRFASGHGAGLASLYRNLPADFYVMPHPAFLDAPVPPDFVRIHASAVADLYARNTPRLAQWRPQLEAARARLQH